MVDTRVKEERLILAAQAGDTRAFDVLYRLYQPSLLRFAYRICKSHSTAVDAVQDAWLQTLRSMSAYPASGFRARIFKAVRWRTLDYIRRSARIHEELNEETVEDKKPAMWATTDQMKNMLAALPAEEGEAVYLFYLEELNVAEVALIQDVPAGTVKSRLSRARKRLKDIIEPATDDNNNPSHDS